MSVLHICMPVHHIHAVLSGTREGVRAPETGGIKCVMAGTCLLKPHMSQTPGKSSTLLSRSRDGLENLSILQVNLNSVCTRHARITA